MLRPGTSTTETILDRLMSRAAATPDRLAFRILQGDAAEDRSYAQLQADVARIAARLQSHVAPGDRVVLLFTQSYAYLTALLGCMLAGATPVSGVPPFPPRLGGTDSPRRLQRVRRVLAVFESSAPAVVLGPAELLAAFRSPLERVGLEGPTWVASDDDADVPPLAPAAPGRDHLAFIQFTSGSTGAPSGVAVTHGNLMDNLSSLGRAQAATPDDVGLSWLPFFHDLGLIGTGLLPIHAGFPCVLMGSTHFAEDPVRWLLAIEQQGATLAWAPNFAYDLCVARAGDPRLAGADLRRLRFAMNAAEPVSWKTVEAFAEAFAPLGFRPEAMAPCFGLAEATLAVTLQAPGARPRRVEISRRALGEGRVARREPGQPADSCVEVVACGRPAPGVEVRIVQPETLRAAGADEVGEVWIGGTGVATGGYYRQPGRSAETFQARLASGEGPYLRTGDLGFLDGGELFISGRLKDVVIVRGVNYHAHELERSAQDAHAALRRGCVAAFPVDDDGRETLAIAAEVARGAEDQAEAVTAAIRQAVFEDWMLETGRVVLLRPGSLFKTPSGKLQRRLCRETYLAGDLAPVAEWRLPPSPPMPTGEGPPDAALRPWLLSQLGLEPGALAAGARLADLGVGSLRLAEIARGVERRFDMTLDLAVLFEQDTLERTLAYLEAILRGDPRGGLAGPAAGGGEGVREGRARLAAQRRSRVPAGA